MKKLLLFLLFIFLFSPNAFVQDSCSLRITLLTCSPGNELYSTFGHTAIRVQNNDTESDEVFNYGTFEFSPDFYVQFIRGKLLYALSVEAYQDFIYTYQYESRSVVEQELYLSCGQKQNLYAALRNNAREENRRYRYDFLLDNCTTRARDMIEKKTTGPVVYQNIIQTAPPTFRQLIHACLDTGHQYWSKLGIDLLLGSRIDRQVTNKEAMFLPGNLMRAMNGALVGNSPIALAPQPVLTMPSPLRKSSFFTPGFVITLLCAAIGFLSFLKSKNARKATAVFDFLLFFMTGLTGILLLFMWFGTDHWWCGANYNLLWALPTNAVVAFVLQRQKPWATFYVRFLSWYILAIAICWFILPQQMNPALLPVVLLLLLRSWSLFKTNSYAGKRA